MSTISSKPNTKTKKKTTTELICDNLGLGYQTIFQDYKCTLKSTFSYFGRLYVGEQHLMFVSNMFGLVNKTSIIIDTISKIIDISIDTISICGKSANSNFEQEFVFSGFKNQNASKIIKALWKRQTLSSEVLNSNQEESQDKNGAGKILEGGNVEISLFHPEIVETEKQKMIVIVFPCSVQQFFNFFIADDANVYSRKKHLQGKKATKISVSLWKRNDEMNAQVREIIATLKVKGVPFKSEGLMNQVWFLTKNTSEQIHLKVITQIVDIPFSTYFHVEQLISVTKQTQQKCKFICNTAIVFNKSTYMKGAILNRTFEDLQSDYKLWSDNIKQILDKMKQQKQDIKIDKNTLNPTLDVEYEEMKLISEKQIKITTQICQQKEFFMEQLNTMSAKINKLVNAIMILVVFNCVNLMLNIYQLS